MRTRVMIGVALAAAVAAPALLAATPGAGLIGYGGQAGAVQGQVGGVQGVLPFTGYDLGLVALGAVLLLVVGVALRRGARANS